MHFRHIQYIAHTYRPLIGMGFLAFRLYQNHAIYNIKDLRPAAGSQMTDDGWQRTEGEGTEVKRVRRSEG
jgi:hypothetical protein